MNKSFQPPFSPQAGSSPQLPLWRSAWSRAPPAPPRAVCTKHCPTPTAWAPTSVCSFQWGCSRCCSTNLYISGTFPPRVAQQRQEQGEPLLEARGTEQHLVSYSCPRNSPDSSCALARAQAGEAVRLPSPPAAAPPPTSCFAALIRGGASAGWLLPQCVGLWLQFPAVFYPLCLPACDGSLC